MLISWPKNILQRRLLTGLLVAAAGLLMFNLVGTYTAHAESHHGGGAAGTVEKIRDYCRDIIPEKARGGCTMDNAEKARNVATYHVDDSQDAINSGKTARQILEKAKNYIEETKRKNPSSASDFTKKLETVLKSKGGSLNRPKESTSQGAESTTYTCKPNDALCYECQNGGKGCVECENGKCTDPAADPNANCGKHSCDLVKKYVNPLIQLLTVIFGLIAIISIIIGGIQYSTSEGDPQKVSKAKTRVAYTVIAIVAYFFLYAFLQFLIPGGIF